MQNTRANITTNGRKTTIQGQSITPTNFSTMNAMVKSPKKPTPALLLDELELMVLSFVFVVVLPFPALHE